MEKFGVQLALEELRQSKRAWLKAKHEFDKEWMDSFVRLLHQAAIACMSVDQISRHSGLTRKRIRSIMRAYDLNPKFNLGLLSKTAAAAVQENAALLGIKPQQIDLMSPLAYLPMGSEMREELEARDPEMGDVEQLAQKLTDAGLLIDDAREWVNAVIEAEVSRNRDIVNLSPTDIEDQDLPDVEGRVGWRTL